MNELFRLAGSMIDQAEAKMPKVTRLDHVRYSAFQIAEGGRTYEIDGITAGSLDEAMHQAVTLRLLSHKDHLIIREESERSTKMHLFAVKKRARARYEYRDYQTRAVRDLYLAPVCSFDGAAL